MSGRSCPSAALLAPARVASRIRRRRTSVWRMVHLPLGNQARPSDRPGGPKPLPFWQLDLPRFELLDHFFQRVHEFGLFDARLREGEGELVGTPLWLVDEREPLCAPRRRRLLLLPGTQVVARRAGGDSPD